MSRELPSAASVWGKLWGVSVGPGDSEWLTLKGLQILQAADVVACPQNRDGEPGMAYGIVKSHLRPEQTILPLDLPFVRDPVQLQQAWTAAGETLVTRLAQGQDVVFITEGDASLYSTFSYVAQTVHHLAPTVDITTVPGVCSPLAAMAALNRPLSLGGEKIAILPALYDVSELTHALEWSEVVVLMKVASVFGQVWQTLHDLELLEQASLVEWVGSSQEKQYPSLVDLADYTPPYFSILIVRRHDYRF
ncbi:precorrin-2 c20-methyltransferase [Leptolyngbya sp. Heron Island J]|uniref:precorrin-2 C(20)-methyltransferase n=1 Tax=Leptolyngbya sp. Heron Island J TaxID=1385935 RepID=UPI0003B9EBA9|nr:precorrin-2 C(20)-methyltransferase [Leptolyngbya sp. Heron Island J]ESA38678.1 precorrin-2 c20-methyltransferase [Leptolyngbya sp. Heron Island J]